MHSSTTLTKVNGAGLAQIELHLVESDRFCAKISESGLIRVSKIEGGYFTEDEIEAVTFSGARQATHIVPLDRIKVVLDFATGEVSENDFDAFSICAIVTIARALGLEDELPKETFVGQTGIWRPS